MIIESGTRWPLEPSWTKVGSGLYRGEGGLLSVKVHDGSLIDPGRCVQAETARRAAWQLVRTSNGTAITGTYREQGADVLVYVVRADEADLDNPSLPLPEVQATYVVTQRARWLFERIQVALDTQSFPSQGYGRLDQMGHTAMGPIPIVNSWLPVDDFVDNTGLLGTHVLGAGQRMLIGGGWLMFADQRRCCGFHLQPKAWRSWDKARAVRDIASDLDATALSPVVLNDLSAEVWGCPLGRGLSYEIRDDRGNLRASGAFWADALGQPWRLHYWINPEHLSEIVRALCDTCISQ